MAKLVSIESIEKARTALSNLAKKERERRSRKDAVLHIRSEIQAAMSKGHTLEEVVAVLTQSSADFAGISLSTVRTYLKADKAASRKLPIKRNPGKSVAQGTGTPPPSPNTTADTTTSPGIAARQRQPIGRGMK